MTINGNDLYFSIITGSQKVISIKKNLNDINVFPVPDGDTGTNLSYTMSSIINKSVNHFSVEETLQSISKSAIEGARGNSGVIMAEYLNGLYLHSRNFITLTEKEFFLLFSHAYKAALNAVEKPVDGSILTVMKDFSDCLLHNINHERHFIQSFDKAYHQALKSLKETQEKMKVLKDAGVVDSGAKGFVSFIEGIYEYFKNGKKYFEVSTKIIPSIDDHHTNNYVESTIEYRYCFELLFEPAINFDKTQLNKFGDSIIVAGNDSLTKVHIHTNNAKEVVSFIASHGLILEQKIDDMIIQQNAILRDKNEIAIVTDSIADLPKSFVDEHNIFVIPLNLTIDNIEFIDRLTIDTKRFFELADLSETFPRSSMPKIKDLERLFTFISQNYKKTIILTVSSQLSGTYNLVNKVLKENQNFGMEAHLIDTKLNSGAQGLLVMKAAKLINAESPLDEILSEIIETIDNTRIYVSVNDFSYMVRGGRVSPLKGKMAKILNLKPIVSLDSKGKGKAFANAFSQKQNFKKMQSIIKSDLQTHTIESYCIVHGNNEIDAIKYKDAFTSIIKKEPEYIEEISSIVGISTGKGAVSISYIMKEGII
ncbi:MAG: DegV family EDD domain-containing protein [Clostridiales bacterium]|nr:DegV family EDD domain-containing protein [Clostridiales bacterium]